MHFLNRLIFVFALVGCLSDLRSAVIYAGGTVLYTISYIRTCRFPSSAAYYLHNLEALYFLCKLEEMSIFWVVR